MDSFPGWCIRCMAWVETRTGMCPVCGATTLDYNPYAKHDDAEEKEARAIGESIDYDEE